MAFWSQFWTQTAWGVCLSLFWFTLPGWGVARLLGLAERSTFLSTLLLAPTLGLCAYGSFSLLINAILPYHWITLVFSWLLFQAIVWTWIFKHPVSEQEAFCPIANRYSFWLLIGAGLWSLLPTVMIIPFFRDNGLYVIEMIFDHAKIALVDSIAREGLLPVNPYYAPDGETIPLIYYYTWHFLASQLKILIPNIQGWSVEVAFNWFTGFAVMGFLMGLATRISQQAKAGAFVLLFAICSQPIVLIDFFGDWVSQRFLLPDHPAEVLWLQMAWVPQHVLSALAVVLAIFLIARLLAQQHLQPATASILGLTVATGFGASTWVGGIGFAFASPALLLMLLGLRLPWASYFALLKNSLLAIGVTILFAFPLLISQVSGPSLAESQLPFGLEIYNTTALASRDTLKGQLFHIVAFWLQYLPLSLGICYLLGIFALFARRESNQTAKNFLWLSIATIFGFLFVTLFVKSTFWNNSFGWRSVLPPVMLLLVWAGVAATLPYTLDLSQWRENALFVRLRKWIPLLISIGVTIGILTTIRIVHLPRNFLDKSPEVTQLHQGFLRQYDAWATVRRLTEPTDIVQSNPDGYISLTPWPATLGYAVFADRKIAYANVEYATVFAYRYDPEKNKKQYQLIKDVFARPVSVEELSILRNQYKIKALLVDQHDPIWSSTYIEQSGVYRLAHQDTDYKVYLATP
ncbi:hypothetical protein BegalDRAFT_1213 [Beggiatoa alba B18LD]|uniref:PMT family glycosyltransferase, 4-amino-4-deoxy-L-arabinose transferase n=1 Tax=Beggiatoa alba B18LD TaxID=395493 RepID=I3CES0_9GAMM|nr:hypothetical protein [Beggiatoa alba]EIJ42113.1 hypothetical protein BegalDRAFT_1213 [Beggiatoa alba B18LD]